MSRWSVVALVLAACEGPAGPTAPAGGGGGAPPPVAPAPPPASTPPPAASAQPPGALPGAAPQGTRVAKALEVLGTGNYTILRMDACGAEAWVAGPKTEVKVGQTVEMPMGTVMTDFHSKELDRTFESILFVDRLSPSDTPLECREARVDEKHKAGSDAPPPVPDLVGTVRETMESGGYTYARLEDCGVTTWVAGPRMPLRVGEVVAARGPMPMKGFSSPTLNRTFEEIQFVAKMAIAPAAPACKK